MEVGWLWVLGWKGKMLEGEEASRTRRLSKKRQ